MDFLGKGGSVDHQHHYSIMLENIPRELRSGKALTDYFEKLFPGKVHSANVVLKLSELEYMSERKLRVTRRLEKAIASFHAKGVRPVHIMGRPRLMIFGTEMKPIGCGVLECARMYDSNSEEEPKRGERVDSISYYTDDLKELNEEMAKKQLEKENVAKFGNRSLIAQDWLSVAASEYADMFRDDESAIGGWAVWLQNTFSTATPDPPVGQGLPSRVDSKQVSFSFDEIVTKTEESVENGQTSNGNYGSLADVVAEKNGNTQNGISFSTSTLTIESVSSDKQAPFLAQEGISYSMDSRTPSGGILKSNSRSEPLLKTVPESKVSPLFFFELSIAKEE